jgi:AbrB family looped-hinge helix DNA binding protein
MSLHEYGIFTLEDRMKKFVSTISSKGQVTIPADIRRKLGVNPSDQVTFVLTEDEKVELRPVRYTLESVLGSIEALPGETADLDREIREATEEAMARKMQRLNRQ